MQKATEIRMLEMIEVKKKSALGFSAIITEGSTRTEHHVTLDDGYYQNLSAGKITKEELINPVR